MHDRRRFSRIHLVHYLTIFNRDTGRLVGNLVDVSPAGIMLVIEAPIAAETLLPLRMNFPEQILARQILEFDARVIWCRRDINPDMYAIGLELLEVERADRLLIDELINLYED